MIDLALRTTVVFALAFAIAAVLRRATPATRHLLWHLTMLIVVAAPLVQPLAPRIPLPNVNAPSIVAHLANSTIASTPSSSNTSDSPSIQGTQSTPRTPGTSGTSSTPGTLWFLGSLIAGIWFAIGWLTSLSIAYRASQAPGALQIEARAIARELRLRRVPDVRVMESTRGPLTVGIFRPVILLPAIAVAWHPQRRRAVLAHELAHVRRGDTRTQALAHAACALYWFNPLAWMAARALRRERERACDDAVLTPGVGASSYAQDLLDIAQLLQQRLSSPSALAMARRTELEGRLLSLLAADRHRQPRRLAKWAVVCTMMLCAVVTLGAGASGEKERLDVEPASAPLASATLLTEAPPDEARSRSERARAALHALAHSDDEDARERAALELALSGSDSDIEALVIALDDTSGQVREKAAIGLGLRSSPEVVEPLLRALKDPDAQVREKAAAGLTLRRDPRVVDALLVAIHDKDGQVREKAAMALGTCGDARAIPALKAALDDSDSQVREKATIGLALLTSSPMETIDRRELESGLSRAIDIFLRALR